MKEDLKKRAFVPAWLLGTIHDPTYENNEASSKAEESPAVKHVERSGNTVVAFPKKLRAA
ncbi:MAG: hypothetical protein WCT41_02135 [Candidatus Paceibacterota bacterium]|jgi:hypothetical protein